MILFLELSCLDHPGHIDYPLDPLTGLRVPVWRPHEGPRYAAAPVLLALLRPYLPRTQIVLTDWGMTWPNPALDNLLPAELLDRIIDVVWLLDREDYRSDLADLAGAIGLWLRHRGANPGPSWFCLNRRYHGWPEAQRDLLIDGTGLHAQTLRPLLQRAISAAYTRELIHNPAR